MIKDTVEEMYGVKLAFLLKTRNIWQIWHLFCNTISKRRDSIKKGQLNVSTNRVTSFNLEILFLFANIPHSNDPFPKTIQKM